MCRLSVVSRDPDSSIVQNAVNGTERMLVLEFTELLIYHVDSGNHKGETIWPG